MNVFLAEDDPAMNSMYKEAFSLYGHRVDIAHDGREALEKLTAATEKPALILLDIMMPKMNGFEVLSEVKKNPALKDVPVVALTNLASLPGGEADLKKITDLGAETIIIKSQYDPKDVVKRAEALLEAHKVK